MSVEQQLDSGLERLGFSDRADLVDRAISYQSLLLKWNKVTNLTAITDPEQVITHHLLDAFAVNPWITGKKILDVGSGGGIPGIPLALANPDKDFILLDPNGKKTRFMTQAKIELSLGNVTVIQARVEDHSAHYDQVVSRAFRQISGFVETCARLVVTGGSLLAMKGPDFKEELAQLPDLAETVSVSPITVPGMEAERFLVEISC